MSDVVVVEPRDFSPRLLIECCLYTLLCSFWYHSMKETDASIWIDIGFQVTLVILICVFRRIY